MFHTPSKSVAVLAVIALVGAPFLMATEAEASDPLIATIMMFGGNFAPRGWAQCDGQLLAISTNTALFSILGTTYGGNGTTTFGLPDLRGRVAMHYGSGPGLTPRPLGQKSGVETVTLNISQIPSHGHVTVLKATSTDGNQEGPANHILAGDPREDQFSDAAPNVDMNAASIVVGNTGGSQAHTNVQPYQCVNFIIALVGIFPSRS